MKNLLTALVLPLTLAACGGGDDESTSPGGPALTDRQGNCGVYYPVVPSGKTFAVNLVTDQPGAPGGGRYSALAASGTGFPAGETYDLRIAPTDATDKARQAMGARIVGPLMEGSWCAENLAKAPTAGDTLNTYWPEGKGPSPITYLDGFPEARPNHILEGFTVHSNWSATQQRVYFNIDPAKYQGAKFDNTTLGICRATVYGAASFSATCSPATVTPTATGFVAEALLDGEPRSGYSQVFLVSMQPRKR